MKVREVMTKSVGVCGPRTNAASIADILWTHDCGSVPVVDEKNRILGIVTDRDLCIALGTRNCRPSELLAEEVMCKDVATGTPEDDILQALRLMQTRRVRRIPIVDRDRTLVGMVSIYDVIQRAARSDGAGDFSHAAVVSAMAHIAQRASASQPALS